MSNDYQFSPEEEKAYLEIKNNVIRGKHGVDDPVAIVLGGQPGSGKSNLYEIARERFEKNIVELDCDKFRKFHPNSEELNRDPQTYGEKTNPFVFAVTDRLIEELSENGYNMIIESSMKSPNSAYSNYELLTPKGYKIEAHIMATPKETSWQGISQRYEDQLARGEQARTVPKKFHDYVVEHISDVADEIYKSGKMSNIQVYNRDKKLLYDFKETSYLSPKNLLNNIINQSSKVTLNKSDSDKHTYIKIVSEDELKKLKESGLKFGVCRKDGKIAIKFLAEHKNKVDQILKNKPVIKK